MKKVSFKDKNIDELKKALEEAESSLLKLKFENTQRKLKNFKEIPAKKREIARIKTEITFKELANAR